MFEQYIGVDYSGAGTPDAPVDGIRVCRAKQGELPRPHDNPALRRSRWCRAELAEWLISVLEESGSTIVGIDHAFSFPAEELGSLADWDEFLEWFCGRWRTDHETVSEAIGAVAAPDGVGYRLTDTWSSSAQSIFHQKGIGVFHSTFAGIPWLRHIRRRLPEVFFWPFDGRTIPPGRSAVVEVYPAIFKRRYANDPDCPDNEHRRDAYAVCRWLAETNSRGLLEAYLDPPLTDAEWDLAHREGWILGLR